MSVDSRLLRNNSRVISRHFIDDLFLVPMKGKKGAARRVILNSGNGGHRFQG
jgi:hypothetical protein